MAEGRATLYGFDLSHPSRAAKLMLDRKGADYRTVPLLPGIHIPVVRAAGFSGATVPALKIDGERVQGTVVISEWLERNRSGPRLYPEDPAARTKVREAELWGESELQPLARRILRWSAAHSQAVRRWLAADAIGMPMPGLAGALNRPIAQAMVKGGGVDEANVRADIASIPSRLDRVEELLEEGIIGGEEPNAADFQIATSVQAILLIPEVGARVGDRPLRAYAERIDPAAIAAGPQTLPAEWMSPLEAGPRAGM